MNPPNRKVSLRQFWIEEAGAIYPATSFLMATLVIAIPLGMMFLSMYESLCEGGRQANLLIGLF